jgi:hypothetical protein
MLISERPRGGLSVLRSMENTMTRIPTLCVVSSALTVLVLFDNGASAEVVKAPRINPPKVSVHPNPPKGYIEKYSFDFGATNVTPGVSNGTQAGKTNVGQIVIKKVKNKNKGAVSSYGISHVNEKVIVPAK